MLFRKMNGVSEELSVLGFGCMRFPLNKDGSINEPESERMLKYAVDKGINYIDTAWPYHKTESEPFVGRTLKKYNLRDKVKIATKLPSWLINSREDMDEYFNKQLERLQTDHIEFYLVHALNKGYWENLKKNGIFEFLDYLLKEKKVSYVGFSFHDELPLFKEIVDEYDWTFCQIQYNYMDEDYQAGLEGLEYASSKGLGVIIMEPLRGGKIVSSIPDDIMGMWNSGSTKRTPAEWALRWVWNRPDVTLLLSGMSTFEQLDENIKIASEAHPESLTKEELELVDEVKEVYKNRIKVNCTSCNYCMPCPVGVNIPRCFTIYNGGFMYNNVKRAKNEYVMFMGDKAKASNCVECGKCEKLCPQNIGIISELKKVAELFETKEA